MSQRYTLMVFMYAYLVIALPAWGQTAERTPADRVASAARTAEQPVTGGSGSEAVAVLRRGVERVDWEEQAFADVLDWLRGQGELNVVVVWRALPVDEDATVNLLLFKTTVAEVLNEVLSQLGEDEEEIIFRACGSTIRISTRADFERKLAVRVYDVTDLLQRTPSYAASAPQIDLQQAAQSGQAGSGGGRGAFTGGGGNETERGQVNEQEQQRRVHELIDTIRQTIRPEFWFETERGPGRIRALDTSLVVRASAEVHEEIAGFFLEGQ